MCAKSSTSQNGAANLCRFTDLTAGVWVDKDLLIIYESDTTMRKIELSE